MATPVTVVVGLGGGGIGDQVAKKFASQGHKVALLARSADAICKLAKELGPNAKHYVCDATVSEQVGSTVEKIVADFGRIDVLIFNAGMGIFKSFDDTTEAEMLACLQSGASGLFNFVKRVKPLFLKQEPLLPVYASSGSPPVRGVIGVTGATASWRGMPSTAAFAPSKFALRALAQSLSRDLGPQNIHVFHTVIDGIVGADRTRGWMPNKPRQEFLDPGAIAETYYHVAMQPTNTWTTEMNFAPGPVMKDMVSI